MRDATRPLAVGVVGVGFGRAVHVPAFRADGRFSVRTVCASSGLKAAKVARELEVDEWTGSWRDVVEDPAIDVVSLAVPPVVQTTILLEALKRGKAVFCEKPLAPALSEARALSDLAHDRRTVAVVDFEFPEIPAWQETKALLAAGAVGRLRAVHVSWEAETWANRHASESWKTAPRLGGGALLQFVSHVLHYLEWFVEPIAWLDARCSAAPHDRRPGETCVQLHLELQSGVTCAVTVITNAPDGNGHRIAFHGDDGSLVLHNASANYVRGFRIARGGRGSQDLSIPTPGDADPEGADPRVPPVSALVRRLGDWILDGEATSPSLVEALRVQELLDAARRADAERLRIRTLD